jgi:hypothetical protein
LYFKGFSRDIIIINQIGSSLKYSSRLMIQGYNASLPRGTRWYLAAGRMYGWSQFKCLLSLVGWIDCSIICLTHTKIMAHMSGGREDLSMIPLRRPAMSLV